MKRILILISGRGSNMQALVQALQGQADAAIVGVISNVADAPGLEWARQAGLATACVPHRSYADRPRFEAALQAAAAALAPDLIVLAGFMRILGAGFIEAFPDRIINVHPALLPAFEGLHTHRRALAAGTLVHGCTVHGVTPQLDRGPILFQGVVPVLPQDTEAVLSDRVLSLEHQILPAAVLAWIDGGLTWQGDQVIRRAQTPRVLLHPHFLPSSLLN